MLIPAILGMLRVPWALTNGATAATAARVVEKCMVVVVLYRIRGKSGGKVKKRVTSEPTRTSRLEGRFGENERNHGGSGELRLQGGRYRVRVGAGP
jgi:hypothetical protein